MRPEAVGRLPLELLVDTSAALALSMVDLPPTFDSFVFMNPLWGKTKSF